MIYSLLKPAPTFFNYPRLGGRRDIYLQRYVSVLFLRRLLALVAQHFQRLYQHGARAARVYHIIVGGGLKSLSTASAGTA